MAEAHPVSQSFDPRDIEGDPGPTDHDSNGAAPPDPPRHARTLFWPALQTRPRPGYVIKGLIEMGSFGAFIGPSGSGKTFEALDAACHVAAGRYEWRGCRVRQGGVLYVSAEGGAAIVNRLDAWARHYEEDLDTLPLGVVLDPTNVLEPNGVAQVIADAQVVPDLVLIIIDTAARVMPGGDEGTEDMGLFVAACDRIRAATGASVAVVHHTGKDVSRGSRGSSLLPAALDWAAEITHDKATAARQLTITKARDGETGRAFPFRLERMVLGTDDDGDEITSCVAVEAAATPKRERSDLTANQATLFSMLKAAPAGLTVGDWNEQAKAAGIGRKRAADLYDTRDTLRRKGLIYQAGDLWFAKA